MIKDGKFILWIIILVLPCELILSKGKMDDYNIGIAAVALCVQNFLHNSHLQ